MLSVLVNRLRDKETTNHSLKGSAIDREKIGGNKNMMSLHDLNESSRFVLDYDPDGDPDDDASASSQRLTHIAEGESILSTDSTAAPTSSMDSNVLADDVRSTPRINSKECSSVVGGGGHWHVPNEHVGQVAPPTANGTLQSSLGSDSGAVTSKCRKLVKVKLWDAGKGSSQPSVVTVALDLSAKQGLGEMHHLMLGLGQNMTFQNEEKNTRRSSEGELKTIAMAWQPPKRLEAETWQPPLIPSDEDRERSVAARANGHRDEPQSIVESGTSIPPKSDTSIPRSIRATIHADVEVSEVGPLVFKSPETTRAPVKGLEPFIIPSIVSCKVMKRTPSEKVGLSFRKTNDTIVIDKITPGSAFAGTAIRPGYECLSINCHRLRSARRAAEIIRDSKTSLILVASNAPRPPGTMYTMISLKKYSASKGYAASMMDLKNPASSELVHSASMISLNNTSSRDSAAGMYFKKEHGLVKIRKVDSDSPIESTSMQAGDFILAINGSAIGSVFKAVNVLSDSRDDNMVPILYFSMRKLRVSLVEKVTGDLWKKEWSSDCDECVVLQPQSGSSNGSSIPMTLRFKEDGSCQLLDPLRSFRDKSQENHVPIVPSDHPLNLVVETLNDGIMCVVSALRKGVELSSKQRSSKKEI
jgi:hypothetical protein